MTLDSLTIIVHKN